MAQLIVQCLVYKQESKGRYGEALKYFNVAAQVQPDDVGAHINVGRTLNNLGQFEEAEKVYLVRLRNGILPIRVLKDRITKYHLGGSLLLTFKYSVEVQVTTKSE